MKAKYVVFAASACALVAAFLYLRAVDRAFVRELPATCNAVLDTDIFLTAAKIRPHLQCLGARGRSMYLDFYKFDLIAFPSIYANFAYRGLSLLWSESKPVLPIAVVLFDVLENSSMLFVLLSFPAHNESAETAVTWFLRLKYATVAAMVGSLVAGLAARFSGQLALSSKKAI